MVHGAALVGGFFTCIRSIIISASWTASCPCAFPSSAPTHGAIMSMGILSIMRVGERLVRWRRAHHGPCPWRPPRMLSIMVMASLSMRFSSGRDASAMRSSGVLACHELSCMSCLPRHGLHLYIHLAPFPGPLSLAEGWAFMVERRRALGRRFGGRGFFQSDDGPWLICAC